MSVGIFKIEKTPAMTISIAITTNVYGRRSARRTIHMVCLGVLCLSKLPSIDENGVRRGALRGRRLR
jgi:hypothetical protein